MRKRFRSLFAACLCVALLAVAALRLVDRDVRQNGLNQRLIAAVRKNDTSDAIRLLNAGADPNARETAPDTRPFLVRLRDVLTRRNESGPGASAFLLATGSSPVARRVVTLSAPKPTPPNIGDSAVGDNLVMYLSIDTPGQQTMYLYTPPTFKGNSSSYSDGSAVSDSWGLHTYTSARANYFYSEPCPASLPENLALVDAMLAHGADVNARSAKIELATANKGKAQAVTGQTPLMLAILQNRRETVKRLLAHGANVDAQDSIGQPASAYTAMRMNNVCKDLIRPTQAGAKTP